jgi:hypothetical protein
MDLTGSRRCRSSNRIACGRLVERLNTGSLGARGRRAWGSHASASNLQGCNAVPLLKRDEREANLEERGRGFAVTRLEMRFSLLDGNLKDLKRSELRLCLIFLAPPRHRV